MSIEDKKKVGIGHIVGIPTRVAFFKYLSPTGKNSQKPVSDINANKTAEIQTLSLTIARKGNLKGKAQVLGTALRYQVAEMIG